jgi:hypothetical protein
MHPKSPALPRWARRALVVAVSLQLTIRVVGVVAARRRNVGDASSSPRIRRVKTMGQVTLRPTSQELARVEVDLALAGVEMDLTAASPAPGGLDLILTCAMAGGDVRVPSGWTVARDSRGLGGIIVKGDLVPAPPAEADLRVDLRAFAGGVTLHAG